MGVQHMHYPRCFSLDGLHFLHVAIIYPSLFSVIWIDWLCSTLFGRFRGIQRAFLAG